MRSLVRSVGVATTVLLLAGVQKSSAQIIDTVVDFTTSFPFTVGNATVPAGSYTIRTDDDNPQILILQGKNASALFQVDPVSSPTTPSKTEIVFSRYGNSYLLKNIWIEGSDSGLEAVSVEGERHAAKAGGAKSEQRIAAHKKSGTASGR